MSKCMTIFAASALALSLTGAAVAADNPQTQDQKSNPSARPQEPTGNPAMTPQHPASNPADQSKQDQEYLAELKKCESLQDAAKEKCVDNAKQKFNRM